MHPDLLPCHRAFHHLGTLAPTCCGCGGLLLLLVVDELEVILGDVLVLLQQELFHLITNVSLHDDFLPSAWDLCNGRAGRELLAEIFGDLRRCDAGQ